jgi:hypothetical protein
MNYLEIIELRSSNKDYENLSEKLTGFIDDLNKEYENYTVKLYRHLTVETDWSFHIQIQTEINFTSPSQLGLRIASALKEFGLVHHSVWSEEKRGY